MSQSVLTACHYDNLDNFDNLFFGFGISYSMSMLLAMVWLSKVQIFLTGQSIWIAWNVYPYMQAGEIIPRHCIVTQHICIVYCDTAQLWCIHSYAVPFGNDDSCLLSCQPVYCHLLCFLWCIWICVNRDIYLQHFGSLVLLNHA